MNILGWFSLAEAYLISNSISNSWLVATLGGWSAIIIGISVYLGYRIADKMKIKWNAEANENLEKLRAEITQEQSVFKIILDSYSKEFQFTQSNRIKAIEKLWDKILIIRELAEDIFFYYRYDPDKDSISVHNNEIAKQKTAKFVKSSNGKRIGEISVDEVNEMTLGCVSYHKTMKEIKKHEKEVEKYRPFLGEYLWMLFNTYTSLIGHVTFIVEKIKNGQDNLNWQKDERLCKIIENVFNDDEKNNIHSTNIDSFKTTTEILERKILYEIAIITSGELAANNNFGKAVKIQQLLDELNKESKII